MRVLGRLISLLFAAWSLAMAIALVAAYRRKQEAPPPSAPDADEIRLVAAFEEVDYRSTATALRGGTIECWFAGGTVDLRGATLDPAGARLTTKTIFGGGQLLVPQTWRVTAGLTGLGGVGDARNVGELPVDAPHLELEGTAWFGGWGIMSEDPRGVAAPAPAD
jgi:hypothetical protein